MDDAQLPLGRPVTNADVVKCCKFTHRACRGTGLNLAKDKVCPEAEKRFRRRFDAEIVLHAGALYWKDDR